jgi:4'-phosphopantetheinyl transferase
VSPPAVSAFATAVHCALAGAQLQPPQPGEVSVVLFETTDWAALLPSALVLLGLAERDRAARFRYERDRTNYVVAHALWRVVLARCLDIEPTAVPLQFAPSGQPKLPGTFSTSLSHSGEAVLVGIGRVVTLGVDIERTPPRIPLEGLMATLCAPDEAVALQDVPATAREHALLQLWTRKEALLKAFGLGLTYPPAAFSAVPGVAIQAPSGSAWPACYVHDLVLPKGKLGSLAVPEGADQPVVRPVSSIRVGEPR